jgi:hypothetical protein
MGMHSKQAYAKAGHIPTSFITESKVNLYDLRNRALRGADNALGHN